MNRFSKNLIDIYNELKKTAIEKSIKDNPHIQEALEKAAEKDKNINPLTEIPEPIMMIYEYNNWNESPAFFDTEEELLQHIKNSNSDFLRTNIFTVEYMGEMAGRTDVIRRTDINGNSKLHEEHIESLPSFFTYDINTYDEKESYRRGEFCWSSIWSSYSLIDLNKSDISQIYNAFRKRGIKLAKDKTLETSLNTKDEEEAIINNEEPKKRTGVVRSALDIIAEAQVTLIQRRKEHEQRRQAIYGKFHEEDLEVFVTQHDAMEKSMESRNSKKI